MIAYSGSPGIVRRRPCPAGYNTMQPELLSTSRAHELSYRPHKNQPAVRGGWLVLTNYLSRTALDADCGLRILGAV